MMKKFFYSFSILLISLLLISGCKDNSTENPVESSRMTLVASYNTPGFAQGIFTSVFNNSAYAFVADGPGGLQILNVTNPTAPSLTGSYNTPGTATDVFTTTINSNNYAFISDASQGLIILNVTTPSAPVLDTAIYFPGDAVLTSFIDSVNRIAYIGTFLGILYIYDISPLPGAILQMASFNAVDNINEIQVSSGIAYLAASDLGIIILNVANPSQPSYLSGFDTPGYANDVQVNNNLAYVADGPAGITILDVTDPFNPEFESNTSTLGVTYSLILSSTLLYLAEDDACETYSISNPVLPVQAGYFLTSDAVTSLSYYNGYLLASGQSNGMLVIKFQ